MYKCSENCFNSQSKHILGIRTKTYLSDIANKLLHMLNASNYNVVFTSSATEAHHHIIQLYQYVFVSSIEHSSILNLPHVKPIPVDKNGAMDLDILRREIQGISSPFLVSASIANHETGIINDLSSLLSLVRDHKGYLHTDAVQAFGRIDLSINELDADYVTMSSYKHGGPIGIAALLYKHNIPMKNFFWGLEVRAGTIPVPLIAGFVESLQIESGNNSYLEKMMYGLKNLVIVGKNLSRLSNTSCIYFTNIYEHGIALLGFDINGVCVSSGSACSVDDRSNSAYAMGIKYPTIRISSGWDTTDNDFNQCYNVLKRINDF